MSIRTEKTNMPFFMKDCALIARMAGIDTAINLREMRERLLHCPIESIFHHFCETVIRPTFDDPEYRNDFAIWAARDLQDRVLAEQLGIINPYSFHDLEEVRRCVIDIIDDRLSEVTYIPWVKMDNDFRFMRAVTVVFDAGKQFELPEDLVAALPEMSLSSVYYHYVEARRRTENHKDDFTVWLSGFGSGTEGLIEALGCIDFYFMSLPELKACLVRAVAQFKGEPAIG